MFTSSFLCIIFTSMSITVIPFITVPSINTPILSACITIVSSMSTSPLPLPSYPSPLPPPCSLLPSPPCPPPPSSTSRAPPLSCASWPLCSKCSIICSSLSLKQKHKRLTATVITKKLGTIAAKKNKN